MITKKDDAREAFRNIVLKAMDEAARDIFGERINRNDAGATDGDLPHIFPALDAQLDRLAERYGQHLYEDVVGHWPTDLTFRHRGKA